MPATIKKTSYVYSFNYDNNENELCKLESRHIFNAEEKDKLLFSDVKVDPSISTFIKKRLDISLYSEDYVSLIDKIKKEGLSIEGFKVEYLVLDGDVTEYPERLEKLREIGYSIEGMADYRNPTITYALCNYNGIWYFGILTKDKLDWLKHKQKPRSYSNSIVMSIAKVLVNVASKADKEKKLIDTCCGVGTIMLEACFAGNDIEGCEINWKISKHARENLSHFNYTAKVYHSDIKDVTNKYDAGIIDLPYNLYSFASENTISHIIESTAAITDRIVIVSTSDITEVIHNAGLSIIDYCSVKKIGKTTFVRKIWVCEKKLLKPLS